MGLPKRPSALAAVALIAVAASVALAILALYHVRPAAVEGGGAVGAAATIRVYSPAYGNGSAIPAQYTCDGADISPPLAWSGVPQGAKSLLVEMVDPDAPGGEFIHWVIYNISPNSTGLPQGVPPAAATAYGLQAVNDFGEVGYGGPCPPPGQAAQIRRAGPCAQRNPGGASRRPSQTGPEGRGPLRRRARLARRPVRQVRSSAS
jgi:Raf kinase inhibitor-like YbhB/YbcL family protein